MAATTAPPKAAAVPPLAAGDRLTQPEFHRRYLRMPQGQKWELVEGVVYMASPMRARGHGREHALLMAIVGRYYTETDGIEIQDNTSSILDDDNEPQPDAALIVENGGQTHDDLDGYSIGPPEFIAEIAGGSAAIDLGAKFRAYRRNRVREYLVWRTLDQAIDWFEWHDGEYRLLAPDADGLTRSRVMPGLWLDLAAMVARNKRAAVAAVDRGLASPEHAAFVAVLAARRPAPPTGETP